MLFHAERLKNVDDRLIHIVAEAAKQRDILVVSGYRTLEEQADLFKNGVGVKPGASKHNRSPSEAVDLAPVSANGKKIDWNDVAGFRILAAAIIKEGEKQGVKLKWGGMFKKFDGPHFELV